MILILDTHTFFWHIGGNSALSDKARAVIRPLARVGYKNVPDSKTDVLRTKFSCLSSAKHGTAERDLHQEFSLLDSCKRSIEQEGNIGYVSIWELAIKVGMGKLTLAEPFDPYLSNQITRNGFDILPIQFEHTAKIVGMPYHHRDPFDRLIMAQSLAENIPILSVDTIFDDCGVQRIW